MKSADGNIYLYVKEYQMILYININDLSTHRIPWDQFVEDNKVD